MNTPAPTASSVCNNLAYEAIVETCALAESYATSAREAAWRGDQALLKGHLMQLRLCTLSAIQVYKEHLMPSVSDDRRTV